MDRQARQNRNDRLGPQDASFLYIENEFNHMHIASVAIFEGPAPQQDEVERMISSKLDQVPRYRQVVRFVPLDLGRPVWCDDPHFNLRYHIRHTGLPEPGSEEQLRTMVGRVMSQQLDRAKPLWEIWVVEGLQDDRWALLSKTHHCMVDGVSGTDLMSALMDDAPDVDHPLPAVWKPGPRPSPRELLQNAVRENLSSPVEGLRALRHALATPKRFLEQLGDIGEGLGTFRRFGSDDVESSLNGPISPHRRWCWAESDLADIKKIRSQHGGTINDVVLAVITRGFRDLLLSRGEDVTNRFVRSLVPVSVRREDERGTYNNRVSAMFAELPVGFDDPIERLSSLHLQMRDLKEHHQAVAAETLTSLTGFGPPALLALAARLLADIEQHSVQTVTTNVPGPQRRLYAAGRPMVKAYPYVPLVGSVRIGVAIFSYAGSLTFGITGDYDGAPDIDILARGIETGVQELLSTV
jgi:diacylglycerol O-acyltransferase